MSDSFKKLKLSWLRFIAAAAMTLLFSSLTVSAATYKESDYSKVYDYSYYISHNKDLPSSVRKSRTKALAHFVERGMAQGRSSHLNFNIKIYKSNYPDLVKLYGNNLKKYYLHFQQVGYKRRYAKHPLSYYRFKLTVNYNGGVHNGHTSSSTRIRLYGTTITLPSSTRSGYTFAGWKLTKGLGTLSGSKFKYTMDRKGENVVTAQWTKKATSSSTVSHYSGAYRIADVAATQIGKGGTTYWNYFKDVFSEPQEWCCMFATYCAYKAGLISSSASYGSFGNGHYPRTASQRELATRFKARGQLKLRTSGYKPVKGDLIFFTYASDKSNPQNYTHVGIVYGRSGSTVTTIEGNTVTNNKYTSKVAKKTYDINNTRIAAYGIIK